jgi:hypothetical protein
MEQIVGNEESLLAIGVECYAGYRGEETPRALVLGDRRVEVAAVLDRWLAPDHRYFKLQDAAGDTYIVRHEVHSVVWELTMYQRGGPDRYREQPVDTEIE